MWARVDCGVYRESRVDRQGTKSKRVANHGCGERCRRAGGASRREQGLSNTGHRIGQAGGRQARVQECWRGLHAGSWGRVGRDTAGGARLERETSLGSIGRQDRQGIIIIDHRQAWGSFPRRNNKTGRQSREAEAEAWLRRGLVFLAAAYGHHACMGRQAGQRMSGKCGGGHGQQRAASCAGTGVARRVEGGQQLLCGGEQARLQKMCGRGRIVRGCGAATFLLPRIKSREGTRW